ncbi:MAG: hypothetical protein OEZ68_10280 [Gammaproteobacteria bacterium]|nr:hypothetical protein [Gammaproteobacteria bacterium]MDH5801177.1 hypothetical protein [Gammaproteobacteria bacterium]
MTLYMYLKIIISVTVVIFLAACEVLNQSMLERPAPVAEFSYEQQLKESERLAREEAKSSMAVVNPSDEETLLTLMRYSRFIAELTKPEITREHEKISGLNVSEPTVRSRFKLAMLLSLPTAHFHDARKAKNILIEFIEESEEHAPTLREYAFVLLEDIDKKAKFQLESTNLRRKLRHEQQLRLQLEQKLEALKSIEESISQRQNQPEEAAQ